MTRNDNIKYLCLSLSAYQSVYLLSGSVSQSVSVCLFSLPVSLHVCLILLTHGTTENMSKLFKKINKIKMLTFFLSELISSAAFWYLYRGDHIIYG